MKIKLLTLAVAVLILGGAIFYEQTRTPEIITLGASNIDPGNLKPFPDVAFPTPDGKTIRVQDLKEKTILVHFWAAWCLPCHAEFPELLKYIERSKGKVGLLAVSLDTNYKDSEKFLRKLKNTRAPHLYWAWDKDKKLSLNEFNTVKVPETIIVNEKHQMVDKVIGVGPWDRK